MERFFLSFIQDKLHKIFHCFGEQYSFFFLLHRKIGEQYSLKDNQLPYKHKILQLIFSQDSRGFRQARKHTKFKLASSLLAHIAISMFYDFALNLIQTKMQGKT